MLNKLDMIFTSRAFISRSYLHCRLPRFTQLLKANEHSNRLFFSIIKHSERSHAPTPPSQPKDSLSNTDTQRSDLKDAMFGAGCFWSVQLHFQRQSGVVQSTVGYCGGRGENQTYEQVCSGHTDHAEVVHLRFDPKQISYNQLLDVFWRIHDPTTVDRQGNDIGTQYRSVIFYHGDEQLNLAKESKAIVQKRFSSLIVTQIEPAANFYPAEEYHQRYLEKGGQSATKGDNSPIRCYG
jgi:methionine-S-sulfoxide reductase